MRGILKPMPDYPLHLLVGVTITAAGREFLVDDAAAAAFQSAATVAATEAARGLPKDPSRYTPMALTVRTAEVNASDLADDKKELALRDIDCSVRAGLCDEPGKPLLMTSKAFAWVKSQIGKSLLVEPIGGDGVEAAATIAARERELDAVRAELAAATAAKDAELDKLRGRLAELENGRRR